MILVSLFYVSDEEWIPCYRMFHLYKLRQAARNVKQAKIAK